MGEGDQVPNRYSLLQELMLTRNEDACKVVQNADSLIGCRATHTNGIPYEKYRQHLWQKRRAGDFATRGLQELQSKKASRTEMRFRHRMETIGGELDDHSHNTGTITGSGNPLSSVYQGEFSVPGA